MNTPAKSTSRSLLAATAILLGCVACCALPFLATLGIAGVAAGWISWMSSHEIVTGILVALSVVGIGLIWKVIRIRRR